MEVKDLSGMADYEIERLEYFKKIYCNKWVHINLQAETEIKIVDKKNDLYEKKLTDTQEQAFWDFHRPMVILIISFLTKTNNMIHTVIICTAAMY